MQKLKVKVRDFGLPPRCKRGLRSPRMFTLHNIPEERIPRVKVKLSERQEGLKEREE